MFARRNEGQVLFCDDECRRRYLATLGVVVARCGWRCLAYCLMSTHMHLLLETPQPNLGRGMQRLHGEYGRWFADRRERPGHVFQSRYGAVRVRDDDQLWSAVGYVARNPVDAGLSATAADWSWSSHAAIIGAASPPAWLDVARLLELLGGSAGPGARERYDACVAERPRSPRAARRRPRARA